MTSTTSQSIPTRIAFILLWIFVFTLPMTQATEIPMIGTISSAAGLAAMVAGAIAVAARKQFRLLGPVHIAMAGFLLFSAVTQCWGVAPELTLQRVMAYFQLFVLTLLLWEMCVEEKDILRILSAFVLGTMIPALATLKAFLPAQPAMLQRASMPGYDPNQLAFLLALSLPAAYYLILRGKGPIVSLYRLQMGFAAGAILLTGSVSSMVAMAVGLSLVFWRFQKLSMRSWVRDSVVVLLLAGTTSLVVPSTSAGTQAALATSFTLFSKTGVVGVVCFGGLLGMLLMAVGGMSGITRSFWFTSLAVWFVGVVSLNWDCSQQVWLIFGLLAAHSACLNAGALAHAGEKQRQSYWFKEQAEACL